MSVLKQAVAEKFDEAEKALIISDGPLQARLAAAWEKLGLITDADLQEAGMDYVIFLRKGLFSSVVAYDPESTERTKMRFERLGDQAARDIAHEFISIRRIVWNSATGAT